MPGLIQSAQSDAPQGREPNPQATQQQPNKEQAQQSYQTLVERVAEAVYEPKVVEGMKKAFQDQRVSQPETIGIIVANLVGGVLAQGADRIPPTIMMRLALEVLTMVTELAIQGGYLDQQEANAATKQAFFLAMEKLGKRTGDMNPQTRQQYAQLIDGIGGLA